MPTARDTTAAAEADGLRIDESERKSWTSIAFIRAGGMFSAPTLMVGAALGLGLALSGAALATLVGFGFIVAYMCFVSMQASDLGLPTASLAAPALGRTGARYLVSLIVGVVTIGWFGVQTAVCGASLALMLADVFGLAVPVWACSMALGALMLATALVGFDGLKWVSSVAAPLLVAICLYGVGASVAQTGSLDALLGYVPLPADAIGLIAGVNMAVGLFAFAGATAGDFARFARTRKDAVLSCVDGEREQRVLRRARLRGHAGEGRGRQQADHGRLGHRGHRAGGGRHPRAVRGVPHRAVGLRPRAGRRDGGGLLAGAQGPPGERARARGCVTGGTFALVPGLQALDLPFFVGPVNGIVVAMAAYVAAYRLTGGERFAGPIAFKRPAESAIMNQVTLDASERAQEGQA